MLFRSPTLSQTTLLATLAVGAGSASACGVSHEISAFTSDGGAPYEKSDAASQERDATLGQGDATLGRADATLGRGDETLDGSHHLDAAVPISRRDPAYLFDDSQLRTFELRLDEADLAFLDEDPKAELYVPGQLLFEDIVVEPVGIRYKGSTGAFVGCLSDSYFPPAGKKSCPKLSMKIKIDYTDPEAKFYRQKKLLFHAMNHQYAAANAQRFSTEFK